MKRWRGHALLAALLAGSLIVNSRTAERSPGLEQQTAAVIEVARSHGLIFRRPTSIASGAIEALDFTSKGCPEPIRAALLSVTFEQLPLLRAVQSAGREPRYYYYDRSWDRPNRLAVFWQHQKQRALSVLGLTRFVRSEYMLFVDAPRACLGAAAGDWRGIWSRAYLAAIKTAGRSAAVEDIEGSAPALD
jgi:hypothetical protein